MLPDKKRRLAAIMFADIVGYTAMMQRNEAEGLANVHRFSEVMETQAKAYEGEILEFKGDGCLVVFDSAVEAVHAAKAIQAQLQQSPAIPLRIGIHLGDIVFTKGNIYGDGVNLASRVESMGVPGSILVTERVIHDVKSHPEFEMTSLGRFQFKNVEKPMEVFAVANAGLAVPRLEEMKGKGEKVLTGKQRMKPMIRLAGVGFVAMVMGAVLFWALGSRNPGQNQLLAEEIREEKVAVSVFENFTGDVNLDALGYLASEWITSSLREIDIRTVAPEMMRQYKSYIGILPGNPEGKTSFAEITKAQYLVSGSYFLQGDSIRLNTRLLDTHTGEEVQQFPVSWAKKSEKELLVEEARQRLMGFWAIKKNQHFPKVRPPKFEAYKQYIKCRPAQMRCHIESLKLDSTFLTCHANAMLSSTYWENDSVFFASKNYIDRHWDQCTEYEKNYYRYALAFWEGDYDKAFSVLDLIYQQDSMNLIIQNEMAAMSVNCVNRPDITLKVCGKIFDEYETYRTTIWRTQFLNYSSALTQLGQHQELISFAEQLPDGDWWAKAPSNSWFDLFLAYLETDQREEAITYVNDILSHNDRALHLSTAAYYWSTFFQDSLPNPFHAQIRQRIKEFAGIESLNARRRNSVISGQNYSVKEKVSYLLGDWAGAERQFLMLRDKNRSLLKAENSLYTWADPILFTIWVESMLGKIYARQGKTHEALDQLAILAGFQEQISQKHGPGSRGFVSFRMAQIRALLGDKAEAVELLKRSKKEGQYLLWKNYIFDWDLVNLRGYEPYEELIRPRERKAP